MYEYLFGIEWLPMYGVMMAIGMLAAVLLFRFICNKKKVDDDTYNFYSLVAIISIAAGLLFALLFQSVYNWIDNLVNKGINEFKLGGLTFMGGLIGGVVTFVLATVIFAKGKVKRGFWTIANYAAPCIVIGHCFGRLGCFFAGCCYGKETSSWVGVDFGNGRHVLPTQLFEALFLLVLFGVMMFFLFGKKNKKFDLSSFTLITYGFAYSVFRFIIEFFRDDHRGTFLPGLTPSQWQSILLFLVAGALCIMVYYFKIIPFARAKDPIKQTENSAAEPNAAPAESSDSLGAEESSQTAESSKTTKPE